ncbi:RNA-binding domain-containing protein [Basidiobolus meristosporus CBS 931.73]|uniref:RNA-binding domain-containing protein n=1 Tax=Basidiobolus meristosporus CBS 931.73 TaxID=1314790 RepID=A0A1Y1Y3Z9_9FUNG|nr:RNA-binding domain-containing protein [Basidiobolus meristosporus CBS 931.73]|eukprot:ORX92727.1 RNA-binding domain-containing protein [Basidiobolus meristosporus CBS 931.73]
MSNKRGADQLNPDTSYTASAAGTSDASGAGYGYGYDYSAYQGADASYYSQYGYYPNSYYSTAATATYTPTVPYYIPPSLPLGYDQGSYVPPEQQDKENSKKKRKAIYRAAAGEVWEDQTLAEWEDNDYRLFAGDLGNEVTEDMLEKAFSKYPSLLKVKVVRDKRSTKSKGYGFLSFRDPADFAKAWKEMNGKYVGNRPIKLRKSTWKDRNMETKRKKESMRRS